MNFELKHKRVAHFKSFVCRGFFAQRHPPPHKMEFRIDDMLPEYFLPAKILVGNKQSSACFVQRDQAQEASREISKFRDSTNFNERFWVEASRRMMNR